VQQVIHHDRNQAAINAARQKGTKRDIAHITQANRCPKFFPDHVDPLLMTALNISNGHVPVLFGSNLIIFDNGIVASW